MNNDTNILTKVNGNAKKVGELGSEFVSFETIFLLYFEVMFCFVQNDLGSKLNALKVNDNQILTKVDGNVKKVGELGSEVVSFSRQLFSNMQLSIDLLCLG